LKLLPGALLTICAACTGESPAAGAALPDGAAPPVEDATHQPPEGGNTTPDSDACAAGARDCLGGDAVECIDGEWVTQARCEHPRPHCTEGRCIECLRGQLACDGPTTVLRCDETGAWQFAVTCSGSLPACLDGRCVECLPGRGLCDGREPIQCRADGSLAGQAPCNVGTRCVFGECVPDQPPAVRILEPADGALFRVGQNQTSVEIAVRGEAVDAEDRGLVDSRLTWSTDRRDLQTNATDLIRGSERRISLYVPKPCQEARHQLTLTALDSAYNHGVATITVVIGCYLEP
jgi:hypothetical protein